MSNADASELGRFDAIAAEWWDPRGPMAALHQINPLRLRYIAQRAGGLDGLRVLDIGCGAGILSEALQESGADVTGIDLAEEAIAAARSHATAQDRDIEYQTISAEALAEERPGHYDLVCCLEMLEHVPDPESIVRACAQLVRPGGDLVFSTINRTPKAFALAIVAAEQVLGLIPKGTHDYAKLIRPSELSAWIRQAGLQLCETRGMHYNPLLKTARMTDDVSINYFIHARAPQ
ncbi:bifunctional 2-polyprenyl-6-hydroxyphenol methylase/3-demethylubiquinol 3-O-methyltransferase UbiG [Algiphilus sp.]|uniref:bifunctional 2-polyprenyl-6-hydroxyphenol methylase/3-demethylubiquinol 3-O-methyltransferase UbiG n=1 Tax=Algiphilus sp. TaxID=1872431 RepID=UPI003B52108B